MQRRTLVQWPDEFSLMQDKQRHLQHDTSVSGVALAKACPPIAGTQAGPKACSG